jgi:hypothetical protein
MEKTNDTKQNDIIPSNVLVIKVDVPYDSRIHTAKDVQQMKLDQIVEIVQTFQNAISNKKK